MNTLICKNCGSSSFIKAKENYLCNHCGSTIVAKVHYPKKRIKFIIGLLIILVIVILMVYKTVVGVDQKLENLNQIKPKDNTALEKNENLRELGIKIREKITKELGHFPLEKALLAYSQEASAKAFFISLNEDGKYAYGYIGGRGSVQAASKSAFVICEKERKKRNLTQLCIPYLVNTHMSPNIVD